MASRFVRAITADTDRHSPSHFSKQRERLADIGVARKLTLVAIKEALPHCRIAEIEFFPASQ